MDKTNDFTAFFENSFAKDFISCNEHTVRRAVTGISASCELLREAAEKRGDKKSRELTDCIMNMCCDLMRNAELSMALSAEKLPEEDMGAVRADIFVRDFVKGCLSAAKGRCTIEAGEVPDVYIRTEAEQLRLLLLGFIRRNILNAGDEKTAFRIECSAELKTLNISVRCLRTFVDGDMLADPDVFSGYYGEICRGLAERTGASAELSADTLSVVIPQTSSNGTAIMETPHAENETGFFDTFSLMLRDI
ncbi:MAG: hypothetical protein IKW96_00875 [Ruminococcus sp.]|uniref:hypothetical protein n=1 Tax=Ruminococcus sp. TaxID=41978 RepID=UPI0025ECE238|nr:hypothetical protein [Ruminococcus sp.]MBR5681817.1 hypothetical protein [Ruminococcus sp.]